jgi:[ribosomal protein S18]-alanine N-acetyltransferase
MPVSGNKAEDRAAIVVRRLSASDIPPGVAILKESPEASMWSEESLSESAAQGIAWVAELSVDVAGGGLAGILVGRIAADEFEILNMAVAKDFRRRGVATQMVRVAIREAEAAGAAKTYLEVRALNQGGIAFYTQFGFRVCGRRSNYYRDPAEDAVLMLLHKNENLR